MNSSPSSPKDKPSLLGWLIAGLCMAMLSGVLYLGDDLATTSYHAQLHSSLAKRLAAGPLSSELLVTQEVRALTGKQQRSIKEILSVNELIEDGNIARALGAARKKRWASAYTEGRFVRNLKTAEELTRLRKKVESAIKDLDKQESLQQRQYQIVREEFSSLIHAHHMHSPFLEASTMLTRQPVQESFATLSEGLFAGMPKLDGIKKDLEDSAQIVAILQANKYLLENNTRVKTTKEFFDELKRIKDETDTVLHNVAQIQAGKEKAATQKEAIAKKERRIMAENERQTRLILAKLTSPTLDPWSVTMYAKFREHAEVLGYALPEIAEV